MTRQIKIIGAAFGNPLSETTFSGVSKYLFKSLEKRDVLIDYLSTKQLRLWDLFDNALDFSEILRYGRPRLNISWIWKRRTVEKLTKRFWDQIKEVEKYDAILQIGTQILTKSDNIKHYCFTDMTIVQAVNSPNAKNFAAGRLPKEKRSEAIKVQRDIFQSCQGMFVNSNWARNSIVCDYNIDENKVHVVGVGVSLPVKSLLKDYNSHNIIFIGREWIRKGGPLLLEAFSLVRKKFPDATLTILGCNPLIREKNVKVFGVLKKEIDSEKKIIEDSLSNAGVLCVPSIFEPYGICFLEAQLYGTPPVTFAGEGRSDSIKDGETGVLLKERTAGAISTAIIDLFSNPDKARKMGQTGYEYVKNNLTWDHVADRVLNIIKRNI